ncbi:hypothetical protein C9374_010326 [Naegleria lovaniensis]|uniref:Xrn1 N-terminal domain-containing protein n=1 Tax=Naegleria lovaniensis TaxID=51637 RepID=A0AA88GG42_NAELO|nr:uncharacterized protein C9374_010326 [Naegleria lovaniensis]KAG2374952.1 hypothetical protein C9374_010326 [Naegleria lovaniensis]
MGISQFYKTLASLFGESYVTVKERLRNNRKSKSIPSWDTYDNIYFDFNTLLYKATHGSKKIMKLKKKHELLSKSSTSIEFEDEEGNVEEIQIEDEELISTDQQSEIPIETKMVFNTVVLDQVMRYLNHFHMRESIFIAIDGPAPRSKLLTQKSRRYLSSPTTNAGNTFVSFLNISEYDETVQLTPVQKIYLDLIQKNVIHERKEKKAISSTWFVPGTIFMEDTYLLLGHLGAILLGSGKFESKHSKGLTFYLSPAEREGEGEFKIIEHIYATNTKERHPKRDLIISGDSDFVLFALNLPPHRHVTLVKDMPSTYHLYDITKLKNIIATQCNTTSDQELSRVIKDITFLSMLSGNDYISRLKRYEPKQYLDEYIYIQQNHKERERQFLIDFDVENPHHMKINIPFLLKLHYGVKKAEDPSKKQKTPDVIALDVSENSIHNIPVKHVLSFLLTLLNMGQAVEEYEIIEPAIHKLTLRVGESVLVKSEGSSKTEAFKNACKKIFFSHEYGDLYEQVKARIHHFDTKEKFNQFLSFFFEEQVEKHLSAMKKVKLRVYEDESTSHIVIDYLAMCTWFMSYIHGKCLGFNQYYKSQNIPYMNDVIDLATKELEKGNTSLTITVPKTDDFILSPLECCVSSCVSYKNKHIVPIQEVREVLENSPVRYLFDIKEDFFHVLGDWTKEDTLSKIREAINEKLQQVPNKHDYSHLLEAQPTIKMTLDLNNAHHHLVSMPASTILPSYSQYNMNDHIVPCLKHIKVQAEASKPHQSYVDSYAFQELLLKRTNRSKLLEKGQQIRKFHTLLRRFIK